MSQRAAGLAWGMFALSLLVMLASTVFLVRSLGHATGGEFGPRGFSQVIALELAVVAAIVSSQRPENPIGWILGGAGLGSAVNAFAIDYATWGIAADGGRPVGVEWAAWLAEWMWIAILSALLIVFALFPDGRPLSRRWRVALVLGVLGAAVAAATTAIVPTLTSIPGVDNPIGVGSERLTQASEPVTALFLILATTSIASLVVRFRRSTGDERLQLKWLAAAATVLGLGLVVFGSLAVVRGSTEAYGFDWAEYLVILPLLGIPVAMGIAILRHRLFDIDVVINRAVVYAALAAFIAVVYVAIVVGVGAAVGAGGSTVLSAIAAAVVAMAFQPARRRAQHLANRLVFGERATPYEVLAELSGRLGGTYSADDVAPRIARIVAQGTGARRAEVWIRVGDELRLAATAPGEGRTGESVRITEGSMPELGGRTEGFAVRDRGELLGAIGVEMPPDEPLGPSSRRLLEDLASQAGLVLRNVRLLEELRASRQRIVAAQDAERRRIERDIHDGAQQQLVALSVKLRLAEQLVERDPAQAGELMAELQVGARDAMENLRDLARGIYPPLLADQGLPAALTSHARKSSVPVDVDADGVGRSTPEVEAAVYFSVLEALQNVSKYAGATRASVRLRSTGGMLAFEVADDGAGFDPATTPRGSGLDNMADRVAALGGTLEIRSELGGGTTVSGRVPALAPAAAAEGAAVG